MNAVEAHARLAAAQQCFFAVFVIPPLLYYALRNPDPAPRFPATISWQVRAGPPKWAHHALWGLGWTNALLACYRSTLSSFAMFFHLKMFAAGVVAIVLAPIGQSETMDKVHYISALVYMIDHSVMAFYWHVDFSYQLGYYISLACFIASTVALRRLKTANQLESTVTSRDIKTQEKIPANKQPALAVTMRRLEFSEMLFENLLFFFFVAGIT
mmetsp:Transcript_31921/g.76255  ORF Transcript_31921/g.76255 Transcript_31921/m.76255 type:complete len:213 (+) Transcript_31921:250-888(+)